MNPLHRGCQILMRICSLTGWIWTGRCKQRGYFGSRQGPHCSTSICGRTYKGVFSVQKVSGPDFIQPWLLVNTAPNFPVRQLISEPSSISSWASQKSILLTVPFLARSQGRKQRPTMWVDDFPFSFVAQFPALERDKKRNLWVIQHLKWWRGECTTGKKFRGCSVPAMVEPGVWNGVRLCTGLKD